MLSGLLSRHESRLISSYYETLNPASVFLGLAVWILHQAVVLYFVFLSNITQVIHMIHSQNHRNLQIFAHKLLRYFKMVIANVMMVIVFVHDLIFI